jgi:hypothetical protein
MSKSTKRKSAKSNSAKLDDLKDFLTRHGVPSVVFRVLPHRKLEHRKDWSHTWHLKEMTENDVDDLQKYILFSSEIKRTLLCLIFWVTRQTRSENTWTQEKEDTYAEGCSAYEKYDKHVMLNDLWDYLTLHNVPEFAKQWFAKHWRHTWELKNMTDNDFVDLNKYAQTLNQERCVGLGHLSGGGGRSRGVVLRLLFSAFVIVNEACMGLHECHQVGVGPRVVGLMMIVLLLFLQKQNLANAIYLFGLGTLLLPSA